VVVVGAAVVGGAVVVGTVVVVGRGSVVGGAVVTGRVLGGTVAAEVRGAAVGGATATASPATVELVVLDSTTVVSGVPSVLPPPAAAATEVGAGQGRPPHSGGPPDPPNAWNPSATTIPAVATPVATHGRRENQPPIPVPVRDERPADSGLADSRLAAEKTPGDESAERGRAGG
jgi:hypothetical protein